MARDPQTRKIDDDDGRSHEYTCVPFGAADGMRVARQLFVLAGPSLAGVLGKVKPGKAAELMDIDLDIGAIIQDLVVALGAVELDVLARDLLRLASRDGRPLGGCSAASAEFDTAYQANYGELVEALIWTVEVNRFGGFFRRLGGLAGLPRA